MAITKVKRGMKLSTLYELTEEDFEAVRLAIEDRLDPAILYFTGGGYGKHGDHYFCTE